MRTWVATAVVSLALVAALIPAVAVRAATVGTVAVTSTVNPGSTLSVAGNGTPGFNLTLNGDDQTTTYTLPVEVVDARGLASGGGWNLTITSTQFKDASGRTFPTTASTITAASANCAATSTCLPPTNAIPYGLAVPAAANAPAAVPFFNAASPTGRGRVDVNATVAVTVPANVIAGTYSSTVTVSIVAGP
jgi:putative surface cell wall-binding protein